MRMCLLEVRDKLDQANIVLDKHRIRSCKLASVPYRRQLVWFSFIRKVLEGCTAD